MPDCQFIQDFQREINFFFRDESNLIEALTHPSYASEQSEAPRDNQRLEFLGDAVIQIIITKKLYHLFSYFPEGDLTKIRAALSKESTLARFARTIHLGSFIRLGHGEQRNRGYERDSILSDAFEAIAGAIYIDCDNDITKVDSFLNELIDANFTENDLVAFVETENPKGSLQEWSQKHMNETPFYKILDSTGPDHEKIFTVGVYINEKCYGVGKGGKRQIAEEKAARIVLKDMQEHRLKKA